MAGGAKLAGAPTMIAVFAKVGLGLLVPRFSRHAALLLCIVMIGAIVSNLTALGGNLSAPAMLLFLSGLIAYLRSR
jgi:putative oxidoreductase